MPDEAVRILDKMAEGVKNRNAQDMRELYADDVIIWHASTAVIQSADESIAMLGAVFRLAETLEYRDVRRYLIDCGAVQQHRLCGTFIDGRPMPDLHACLVIKIRDGKITRVDEYFDSVAWKEVWQRLAQNPAS